MNSILVNPLAGFLVGKAANVTSQGGEDGLIAALFDHIGTLNRWCFEVGAADGLHLSNTFALRQAGWQSLLIEANERLFVRLTKRFADTAHVALARVGGDTVLDDLLEEVGAPEQLDLGVIDVDGPDLDVWRHLVKHRPRVILIEYNPGGDGWLDAEFDHAFQYGLPAVAALAKAKGYQFVARTGTNVLCIDRSILARHP